MKNLLTREQVKTEVKANIVIILFIAVFNAVLASMGFGIIRLITWPIIFVLGLDNGTLISWLVYYKNEKNENYDLEEDQLPSTYFKNLLFI